MGSVHMSRIFLDFSCFPAKDIPSIRDHFRLSGVLATSRDALLSYFQRSLEYYHFKGEVDSPALMTSAYLLGVLTAAIHPSYALQCFRYAMGPEEASWEPLAINEYAKILLSNPQLAVKGNSLDIILELFERAASAGLEDARANILATKKIIAERQQILQNSIEAAQQPSLPPQVDIVPHSIFKADSPPQPQHEQPARTVIVKA